MSGFIRQEAERAIDLGWDKDKLLSLHRYMEEKDLSPVIGRIRPWGIFLSNYTVFYKNSFIRDHINQLNTILETPAFCWTDGSGTTSDKTAGIGVYIEEMGCRPRFISENIGNASNNYAEIMAIWRSIQEFPSIKKLITIHSDSSYALGSISQDWVRNKNVSLIAAVREDLEWRGKSIEFHKVEGHSGVLGNEIGDRLANIGRKLIQNVTDYGCRDT